MTRCHGDIFLSPLSFYTLARAQTEAKNNQETSLMTCDVSVHLHMLDSSGVCYLWEFMWADKNAAAFLMCSCRTFHPFMQFLGLEMKELGQCCFFPLRCLDTMIGNNTHFTVWLFLIFCKAPHFPEKHLGCIRSKNY